MNWQGRGSISTHSLLAATHTPKWELKSLTPKLIFLKMVKRCLQVYPMQNISQGKGPQKPPQDLARNPRRLAFNDSCHPIACPEKPLMVPQLYTALEHFRQPLMLRCCTLRDVYCPYVLSAKSSFLSQVCLSSPTYWHKSFALYKTL